MEIPEKKLSPSAQRVQDAIIAKGGKNIVLETELVVKTAEEAADALGCSVGQIAKSLIFKGKETETPILVIVSGRNRVNEATLTEAFGEEVVKPDADYVREITGFAIGGVAPVGHERPISAVFLDEYLFQYDTIRAAAGTPNAIFQLTPRELAKMTKGKIISVL